MRLLPVTQCQPGDVVADTIRRTDGVVVLRRGVRLSQEMIERLIHWKLEMVPVEWQGFEDIETRPWIPEDMMHQLLAWAAGAPPLFTAEGFREARARVRSLVEEIEAHATRAALELVPAYHGGNPALIAWLNLMLLTVRLSMSLAPEWVDAYALAALYVGLHDREAVKAGRVVFPAAEDSAKLAARVRDIGSVPAPMATSIAQHHAKWDGSGDPPLAGEAIYRGARILGVAETLVLLISRTDEPALPPHEALEWVAGGAGIEFSLPIVQQLQRVFAPYSAGQVVQCGSSEVAVVKEALIGLPTRPRIRLLTGKDANQVVNLAEPDQLSRVITGLYPHREWPRQASL